MSLHSTAMIKGSNLNTRLCNRMLSDSVATRGGDSLEEDEKRRGRMEKGGTGSWDTKTQVPPLAFFLTVVAAAAAVSIGWARTEMRPEQELVVK